MMLCWSGLHQLDADDNWRGANGARCRTCFDAAQERYEGSEKGRATRRDYRLSEAGRSANRRRIMRATWRQREIRIAARTELLRIGRPPSPDLPTTARGPMLSSSSQCPRKRANAPGAGNRRLSPDAVAA